MTITKNEQMVLSTITENEMFALGFTGETQSEIAKQLANKITEDEVRAAVSGLASKG